jgi:hypothetical protein
MVNFKLEDILTSIANAKKFQDKNGYFPNYITVNGQKVQKKEGLRLLLLPVVPTEVLLWH